MEAGRECLVSLGNGTGSSQSCRPRQRIGCCLRQGQKEAARNAFQLGARRASAPSTLSWDPPWCCRAHGGEQRSHAPPRDPAQRLKSVLFDEKAGLIETWNAERCAGFFDCIDPLKDFGRLRPASSRGPPRDRRTQGVRTLRPEVRSVGGRLNFGPRPQNSAPRHQRVPAFDIPRFLRFRDLQEFSEITYFRGRGGWREP